MKICNKKNKILIIIFSFALMITAQDFDKGITQEIMLESFKTQDFDKDGKPAWIISGEKAHIADGKVNLKNADAIVYSKAEKIYVNTKDSIFDQVTKIWFSENNVLITAENMEITGIGFMMDSNNKKIFINNNVKLKLPTIAESMKRRKGNEDTK